MKQALIGISLVLALASCGGGSEGDRRTRVFRHYLKEQFQERIPERSSYYLIIPQGCQGAMVKSLKDIDSSFVRSGDLKLIASDREVFRYAKLPEDQALIDREGKLDRLALPFHTLSLVVTQDGKVKRILSGKYSDGDMGKRIASFLKKEMEEGGN